jgi:LacI family transcriptional regulator
MANHKKKYQRRKKDITIWDVAKKAKVSVATVSHVINKTRFVEIDTKQRVLNAIEELEYSPNYFAKVLRGKSSKTIGCIIADITESYFANVVKAIEYYLNAKGYNLILCDSEDNLNKELLYINVLLNRRIDGLIYAPVDAYYSYEILQKANIPIVQIDRKTYKYATDFVGIDNVNSAEIATTHLVECGYKNIGFIAYEGREYTMEKRIEGYKNVLLENGRYNADLLKTVNYSEHVEGKMKESIKDWILNSKEIDAIICSVDNICFETLGAIEELKLNIPQDIAIISFDDSKCFEYCTPSITSVRQPTKKIGEIAAKRVLDKINDKTITNEQNILLGTELIIRSSSGKRI